MQPHQQRAEIVNLRRFVDQAVHDAPIARSEEATILSLWRSARHHAAGSKIERGDGVQLITSGWAAWLRYAGNGRRLIFLFLMPGDFLCPELFQEDGCDLVSLTPLRTVDADPLHRDFVNAPQSCARIARSGRAYRSLLLDHLSRLTMGSTTKSVASLLVEFHNRSVQSGASVKGQFNFPIGQRVLASALGRSPVQVNKVMSQFQANGLIKVGYDWIDMLQPEKLTALAGMVDVSQTA